jgi:hypothetical protein
LETPRPSHSKGLYSVSLETKSWEWPRRETQDQGRPTAMSAKSKTSLRKAKQNAWYRQERKRHHRSVLGVKPGTAVRSNPGSQEKISDPQHLIIFNKAKKMSSRILISLEGRLKSNHSFTSLLQNTLFRETVFSILHLVRKQENRYCRMKSPFQHKDRHISTSESPIESEFRPMTY